MKTFWVMYIFQFHVHFAFILIFVSKTFEKCVKKFKYRCEIGKKVHKFYITNLFLFSTASMCNTFITISTWYKNKVHDNENLTLCPTFFFCYTLLEKFSTCTYTATQMSLIYQFFFFNIFFIIFQGKLVKSMWMNACPIRAKITQHA